MNRINLNEKFNLIKKHWDPKIIGGVNNMHVKIAKVKGEFDWHMHKNEDEMFQVIKGKLLLKFRDGEQLLKEGEIIIVPKGIEHKPVAEKEAQILMIEKKGTLNTGNVETEKTVDDPEWI
ncbi:Mannose-6-phosphate isomerase, cupin superfamily [Halanaerobium congolense]|jgi:mannose-6-phosphate isomerase-like protein (cupin superfamily)|uniref:Mannose-6-phosphate isomerase, cupin superfamily n=1 Tax=Halanaerobium congolense TaxID=54121 RepID=A0A1I0CZM4_9FIRM|nr:cupin domain-containing protein [Halanaerobium congolense]PTX16031.1 mannose-6-phosphate isomerase-like protein (cupin superfamily) [Halanaerobium congolense]SDG14224.1 Mannose-6-phosphate isomerase, cupin superfamily [Halanaerobium congolense]SET24795.1 Mannose-6-phosphate isomerase, cupin superfamily [Halanaerobium congolense]SFP72989.1 Mannose-6-phosphate isomerase, cupin superfamily [Halanaerobium congolense]